MVLVPCFGVLHSSPALLDDHHSVDGTVDQVSCSLSELHGRVVEFLNEKLVICLNHIFFFEFIFDTISF